VVVVAMVVAVVVAVGIPAAVDIRIKTGIGIEIEIEIEIETGIWMDVLTMMDSGLKARGTQVVHELNNDCSARETRPGRGAEVG
jgi:hypothetical protein